MKHNWQQNLTIFPLSHARLPSHHPGICCLLLPAKHVVYLTMTEQFACTWLLHHLRGENVGCRDRWWDCDGRGLLLGPLNAARFHYRLGTSSLQPIYWESENFCQSLRQQLRPSIAGPWRSNSLQTLKHILDKQILCILKFLFPSLQRTCKWFFFSITWSRNMQ